MGIRRISLVVNAMHDLPVVLKVANKFILMKNITIVAIRIEDVRAHSNVEFDVIVMLIKSLSYIFSYEENPHRAW